MDIADVTFERVSQEEKEAYSGQPKETGSFQGYKLRSYWVCIGASMYTLIGGS